MMMATDSDKRHSMIGPVGRARWWIAALFALGVAGWLASGVFTVASDERGVVTYFGRVHAKPLPGIHYALPWPIGKVYTPRTTDVKRVEVGFKTLGELSSEPRRSDMLTGDENILKIMMVVQYKVRELEGYLFQADQPHWLVERAVESALSSCVALLPVDEVLTTAKGQIQSDAIRIAQGLLDEYRAGVTLLSGNLQVVDPPIPVSDAFKDVSSAKKDSDRAVDEAHAYAGQVLPQAGGKAQEMISHAQGLAAERVQSARGEAEHFRSILAEYRQARQVTRTRLYVESMERLFSKMKVLVLDEKKGRRGSKVTIVDQ